MKVLSIGNQQSFKGYSKQICSINNENCLLFGCHRLYFNDAESLQNVIKNSKIPIPVPGVQKTLDSFHTKPTNLIYFADPYEVVNDYLRTKHDYIVYDNEPSYPDVNKEVSRKYFGTDRKNYGEEFQDIHDYYQRAEDADWKTLNEIKNNENMSFDQKREKVAYYEHRIDVSKYQKDQATTCKNIYNEGNSLRFNKENLEDNNVLNEKKIKNIHENVSKNAIEIANEQQRNVYRRRYLETLEKRVKKYEDLKKYTDECIDTAKNEKEELTDLLIKRKSEYESLQTMLYQAERKIAKLQKENQEAPKLIKGLEDAISKNNATIADIKAKLIPLFDKLKNYYASQGIKVIKKI